MIVKPESDAEAIATWLDFLRHACDFRLSDLATKYDVRRPNLTTFISTKGKARAVRLDKARQVLFSLGMHPDGTLTPGLHRWRVSGEDMAGMLADVLDRSEVSWAALLELRHGRGYLMVRIGRLTSIFAELSESALDALQGTLRLRAWANPGLTYTRPGQDGDAMAQTLWMNPDDSTVLEHFEAIRSLRTVAHAAT
ncbi:MAG: hypothetical protein EPN79_16005 [Burkholderiaceae bacterium]|nr:MAG: hypothetical protein EPN79_16005 [Burkholderiaceae bacterium]